MDRLEFTARLWLALVLPWKILFDAVYAARVKRLEAGPAELPPAADPPPPPEPAVPVVQAETEPDYGAALQLLAILQREGRFIDFLQEEIVGVSDADIGAAARVVHDGCKRGLRSYLELEPVRSEGEGAAVVLEPGFDPARTRITGNVVGEPPFRGTLAHHGWLAKKVRLPALAEGHDARIIAPAEVEL